MDSRDGALRKTNLNLFNRFSLKTQTQHDGALDSTQSGVFIELATEIEFSKTWQEIENHVVVQHVVRVTLESLEIKWSKRVGNFF